MRLKHCLRFILTCLNVITCPHTVKYRTCPLTGRGHPHLLSLDVVADITSVVRSALQETLRRIQNVTDIGSWF